MILEITLLQAKLRYLEYLKFQTSSLNFPARWFLNYQIRKVKKKISENKGISLLTLYEDFLIAKRKFRNELTKSEELQKELVTVEVLLGHFLFEQEMELKKVFTE